MRPFDTPWAEIESGLKELASRRNIRYEHAIIQALRPGEDWSQHVQSPDCLNLSDLAAQWPDIPRQSKEHLRECGFCQILVRAAFPILEVEPFSNEDRGEFAFAAQLPETDGCPFRHAGGWFGAKPVHFLPMRGQYDHWQDCMYCLLLIHYHDIARWPHFAGRCLDLKSWQVYPVYHPEDQNTLMEHIRSCEHGHCALWVPFRFEFNLRRDWRLYRELSRQPRFVLNFRQFVRARFKKPLGDFISSWRFHFGPDAMFSRRHPWAIWDDTDRMLKLLRGQSFDYTERLYRSVLAGETQTLDAHILLWKKYPTPRKDRAKYLLPEHPLQYERFHLEEYLRRDARARKLGIAMEALAELEEREDEELQARMKKAGLM